MKSYPKKLYLSIYLLAILFCIGLTAYVFIYDIKHDDCRNQYSYTIDTYDEYDKNTTMRTCVVEMDVKADPKIGNIMAFYSIHQNVAVYESNALIYQFPLKAYSPFVKSPGYCWNFVTLPKEMNNIKIVFTSPYPSYIDFTRKIYVGNIVSLASTILRIDIVSFFLCVITFCLGIGILFYYFLIAKKVKIKDKLAYLGAFAICLSIWSINDCSISFLLFGNNIASSYISFLALMMLPLPFAMFVQAFYESEHKSWNLFYTANLIQIIICIVLQVTKIADFRDTVWSTHTMMICLVIVVIYNSYLLIESGINNKLVKIHLICIIICITTLSLDLVNFYHGTDNSNVFGRIGFLAYIVTLGIFSTKESADLMKQGQLSNQYMMLAYTDQMTKLNNRTRFTKDFQELSKNPNDIAVIDFDLNNLKKTNDTYGHNAGDKYIIGAATIINEIFTGIANCYRVGGDEFVALVQNASSVDLTQYLAMLESSVDDYNRKNTQFKMQIAYGCAYYSDELDKTLEDTYNRADKIMYKDKEAKKRAMRYR